MSANGKIFVISNFINWEEVCLLETWCPSLVEVLDSPELSRKIPVLDYKVLWARSLRYSPTLTEIKHLWAPKIKAQVQQFITFPGNWWIQYRFWTFISNEVTEQGKKKVLNRPFLIICAFISWNRSLGLLSTSLCQYKCWFFRIKNSVAVDM